MKMLYDENQKPYAIECECGNIDALSGYVYAHWDVALTYHCNSCGIECTIIYGKII